MRFEIEHLHAYTDEAFVEEIRRVSALVPGPKLTAAQFDEHARVASSTVRRRFGGWDKALKAAGIGERFDESTIGWSRAEVLDAIRFVSNRAGGNSITLQELRSHCGISTKAIQRLFGTWSNALQEAGLEQSALGKRYSDEECYENLLSVWVHHGRQPKHSEMASPPSAVGPKAYVRRWGTWRKAVTAFVDRVNQEGQAEASTAESVGTSLAVASNIKIEDERGPREIPLSIRYFVLRRDRFRCVSCGKSPANDLGTILHIDHIIPWSRGGKTVADNLRTLCAECNIGKGASEA